MRLLVLLALSAVLASCSRSSASSPPAAAGALKAPPRNETECRACKGEWGVHGQLQVESCLCRTKDVGKRCKDGLQCEGECLVEDGKLEVVDAGPPPRGYFLGRCSEFDHLFGCLKILMDGTAAEKPTRLDQPPPETCID
jgi:hypothetical protein